MTHATHPLGLDAPRQPAERQRAAAARRLPRPDDRRPDRQARPRRGRGLLPGLREERGIDFVTANGENVAGGMGLTPSTADVDPGRAASTSSRRGNHIWDKREIYPYLEANDRVLRPLNYGTHEVPGRGWGTYQALDGTDIAVINLQGRTYMQPIENPFTDADRLLDEAVRAAAAGPPRRLPLRADVARRTRSGCTSTGGSASSSGRTPTS